MLLQLRKQGKQIGAQSIIQDLIFSNKLLHYKINLPTVVDAKFYEVTNQIILTSHLVDLNYIAFSKAVWDGLTPDQQLTVQRAADAAAAYGRLKQLDKENSLADFIRSQGVEIYEPDLTAFREHVQSQYVGSEAASAWPEGVLEQINALGN